MKKYKYAVRENDRIMMKICETADEELRMKTLLAHILEQAKVNLLL